MSALDVGVTTVSKEELENLSVSLESGEMKGRVPEPVVCVNQRSAFDCLNGSGEIIKRYSPEQVLICRIYKFLPNMIGNHLPTMLFDVCEFKGAGQFFLPLGKKSEV